MKFYLVILAQLLIAAVLGVGIFMATVKGSFWLLIASFVVYLLIFSKAGCLPKQSH